MVRKIGTPRSHGSVEECTQHLGECLDSIFPTAEGRGVGRMLMDAILKLVNKTVGQIVWSSLPYSKLP
jgi:hypothetical protein